MISRHRTITLVAALVIGGALTAAGAAQLRANSASFADVAGDGTSAPDISSVAVSNDEAGNVSFKISVPNRSALDSQDWLLLYLDVDDAVDAEGQLTAEYVVQHDSSGAHFFDIRGTSTVELPSFLLTGFSGLFASGLLTLSVNQRDLDDTTDLNIWLRSGTDADESRDDAPDGDSVWTYRVLSPALYVLEFTPPATARAGSTVRALMSVRGAKEGASTIACTATLGGKPLKGKGDWFSFTVVTRDNPTGTVKVKADPRCAWVLPRSAKGKRLRATITVTHSGLQVSRGFSIHVR